jgi:hypothetical protein
VDREALGVTQDRVDQVVPAGSTVIVFSRDKTSRFHVSTLQELLKQFLFFSIQAASLTNHTEY